MKLALKTEQRFLLGYKAQFLRTGIVLFDDAAATVAKYHEDVDDAIDPKIGHYAYNSPAFT
ncbi:hypothetical protein V7182_21595 [Neobacillus drentensis]|uniref:hypothetical protein n=1 Tax=Neobacillus drentensis TaxID=220684 RepID=UPI002FFE21E7